MFDVTIYITFVDGKFYICEEWNLKRVALTIKEVLASSIISGAGTFFLSFFFLKKFRCNLKAISILFLVQHGTYGRSPTVLGPSWQCLTYCTYFVKVHISYFLYSFAERRDFVFPLLALQMAKYPVHCACLANDEISLSLRLRRKWRDIPFPVLVSQMTRYAVLCACLAKSLNSYITDNAVNNIRTGHVNICIYSRKVV